MDTEQSTKTCARCGYEKPFSAFSRDSGRRDGRCPRCKDCVRVYRENNREAIAARRKIYNQENAEKIAEQKKAWSSKNAEKLKAQKKAHYEKNRAQVLDRQRNRRRTKSEEIAAYQREYRAKNKERRLETNRRWREKNKAVLREKQLKYLHDYRARKAGAEGSHTIEEIRQMYEDQGGLCAYCETPLFGEFNVDHMTPLFRGGSDDWENLAITCESCNKTKHTKTAVEFMQVLRGKFSEVIINAEGRELGKIPETITTGDETPRPLVAGDECKEMR